MKLIIFKYNILLKPIGVYLENKLYVMPNVFIFKTQC